ncbi:hypothetical protein RRG08_061565 [Elysia crispata]|uniref:Uncharacterized protein n=1 Tax=Elysia crispata TaxID=231223 RepID=A0AAE0YT89_9GAST|nr:hypothetical protein RRG08_061565 [Elysia crispata]
MFDLRFYRDILDIFFHRDHLLPMSHSVFAKKFPQTELLSHTPLHPSIPAFLLSAILPLRPHKKYQSSLGPRATFLQTNGTAESSQSSSRRKEVKSAEPRLPGFLLALATHHAAVGTLDQSVMGEDLRRVLIGHKTRPRAPPGGQVIRAERGDEKLVELEWNDSKQRELGLWSPSNWAVAVRYLRRLVVTSSLKGWTQACCVTRDSKDLDLTPDLLHSTSCISNFPKHRLNSGAAKSSSGLETYFMNSRLAFIMEGQTFSHCVRLCW